MTATLGPEVADDLEMLDRLRAYREALGALAAVEGEAAPDADEHLAASEAVITARSRLVDLLRGSGWEPPADVAATLDLDRKIAAQSNGALGG